MEALAAYSVACSVMQTIQFSIAAIRLCKEFYEGRSPDVNCEPARLREVVDSLQPASSNLPASEEKLEQHLQEVVKDVVSVAGGLERELEDLESKSKRSLRRSVCGTIKYMAKTKRRMDKMHADLERNKSIMEMQLLISLRVPQRLANRLDLRQDCKVLRTSHRNRTGALQNALEHAEQSNDTRLCFFLQHLQVGHTKLEDLIDTRTGEIIHCLRTEHEQTRTQLKSGHEDLKSVVSVGFAQVQQSMTEKDIESFMDSLKYQEMESRKRSEAINRTHETTFQWILQSSDDDNDEPNLFVNWLKSGDQIYWISGHPASGKSNLMRFITTSPQTMEYLKQWRPRARLLCGYIWLARAEMQRSQKGLVVSLLYQLLSIDYAARQDIYRRHTSCRKQSITDWSLSELEVAFAQALLISDDGVCIFVDGLDEIDPKADGGNSGLLALLRRISGIANTKMCVSSREETVNQNAYGKGPRLRLHDVNRSDIQQYVTAELGKTLKENLRDGLTRENIEELTLAILNKADGVFLWASVVVNNIIRAYEQNNDDFADLLERVSQLPEDLSDLYTAMWERLNPDDKTIYRVESALFFRLVLESENFKVNELGAYMCVKPEFARKWFGGGDRVLTEDDFVADMRRYETQMKARCAGLLHTIPYGRFNTVQNKTEIMRLTERDLSFIHRSAVDWFKDTCNGRSILQHERRSVEELQCRAYLGHFIRPIFEKLGPCALSWEICKPFWPLKEELKPTLEPTYFDFATATIKRSPAIKFLETENHYIELAVWAGAHIVVHKYISSIGTRNREDGLVRENALLRILCLRLWDFVGIPQRDFENNCLATLNLISQLLSSNNALDLSRVSEGLHFRSVHARVVEFPPVINFLLAFNHHLEQKPEYNTAFWSSPALQKAHLDVLCRFLKHDGVSSLRLKVTVGFFPDGATPPQKMGQGGCWEALSLFWVPISLAKPIGPTSWVPSGFLADINASHIFRYSKTKLFRLNAFALLPDSQRDLITAFFSAPDEIFGGQLLRVFYRRVREGNGTEAFEEQVFSMMLDREAVKFVVNCAERTMGFPHGDLDDALFPPTQDGRIPEGWKKMWEKIRSNETALLEDMAAPCWDYPQAKWFEKDEESDSTPTAPVTVSFANIDWSYKPQYDALDKAITEVFREVSERDSEQSQVRAGK